MAVTDYFTKYSNGSQPIPTTLSAQKLAGASTASLTTATGWDTTTVKRVRVYNTTVSGAQTIPDQSSICIYDATLSGTTLSNLTLVWSATGSDQTHAAGATVDLAVTASAMDDLATGILVSLDQDGTLKAGAVDNAAVLASDVVTTAKILDANVTEAKLTHRPSEYMFDHVASGCVWTGDSYGVNLNASMTAGVVYIAGQRISVPAVTARAFTANKDTYISINSSGTIAYAEVANNAACPTIPANAIWLGIIQSGATIVNAGFINQGQESKTVPVVSSITLTVTDTAGNLICPRDPFRKVLGYRQITANVSTTSTSAVQITGLTVPVIVPTNRKVKITVFGRAFYNTSNNIHTAAVIWDGVVGSGSILAVAISQTATATGVTPLVVGAVQTASGSKTYNISINVSSASTGWIEAAATYPTYAIVELA